MIEIPEGLIPAYINASPEGGPGNRLLISTSPKSIGLALKFNGLDLKLTRACILFRAPPCG